VEEARLGETVKCPKCGREGKLSLHYVYAKGFKYTYLAVAHEAFYGGRKSTRRCSLKLLKKEPAKPSAKQVGLEAAAKPEQEEAARLREENEKLKAEVARLREENARLREAIAKVYEARIASIRGEEGRRAFGLAAVHHKGHKLPPAVREEIDRLLRTLSSVDWVAVQLEPFEQLRGFLA
jgi:hypothetical protein